jgi:chemotaxis protein MotB
MANELIILRRNEPEPEAKKGGVWKIAHADFMTALMAFFLIMWLVNATDEEIKKSIANYFNPMNLMDAPSDRRGIMNPDEETQPPASGDVEGQSTGTRPMGANVAGDGGTASGGGNVEAGDNNTMASAGVLNATDGPTFHDPFAVLASSASDIDPETPVAVDVTQSTLGATGETSTTDDVRDPFDPAYWQTRSQRAAQSLRPGPAETADTPAPDATVDAADRRPTETPDAAAARAGAPAVAGGPSEESEGPSAVATPENPDAVPAETQDPAATVGPRSATAEAIIAAYSARQTPPATAGEAEAPEPAAAASASAAAAALREALAGVSAAVEVTGGETSVLVSLTDEGAISMFPIGSAEPTAAATALFDRVAGVLAERDGTVVVRGHTDARPFRRGTSDNWTLSFARAHATKQALQEAGIAEERFVRVEGLADREPSLPDDPLAAENRRIEILFEPAGATP